MPFVEFEFIVEGPPLSVNTKKSQPTKHRKWQERLALAAKYRLESVAASQKPVPTFRPVAMSITTYYTMKALDVDNVIKPILDSLKGVIYSDDKQVFHLTSHRIDLSSHVFESPGALLADAFDKYSEFVHVELRWNEDED